MKTSILLAILAVGLSGCDWPTVEKDPGIWIYTDADTGCEYLLRWDRAITPRMQADGKQMCHAH